MTPLLPQAMQRDTPSIPVSLNALLRQLQGLLAQKAELTRTTYLLVPCFVFSDSHKGNVSLLLGYQVRD